MKGAVTLSRPAALFVTLCFFLLAAYLVALALSGSYRLEVTAAAEHTDYWQLFFSAGGRPRFHAGRTSSIEKLTAGEKATLLFANRNYPVTWLRIDTGGKPGTVRLYSLVIKRRFADDIVFSAEEIFERFAPGHDGVTMFRGHGFTGVVSTREDPYIVSRTPVSTPSYLHPFLLPVFFISLFFFRFLLHFDLRRARNWLCVERPSVSHRPMIGTLDGLRAAAALMIIADHTWARFRGVGASGVLIFFVLSGFLLARPFVDSPERIRQSGFLIEYGKRRLLRILPMYYFYIFLVYVMSLHLCDAILHAFFLLGNGHLWAVPQEMAYYLIFPAIVLINLLLGKGRPGRILPLLLGLVVLSDCFLGRDIFFLRGMDHQRLPFYLGVFLSGCCVSYLYFGWYIKKDPAAGTTRRWPSWIWTGAGCAVLALFLFLSNGYLMGNGRVFSQQFYGLYGAAAALLLFALIADDTSALGRFFSHSLFRSIGVISYSLYLLHPLVLNVIVAINGYFLGVDPPGWLLFCATVVLSIPVATATYRYIEAPFLTLSRSSIYRPANFHREELTG